MEINRNQYFMAGLVLLFLGIQFHMVDAYVLNEKASQRLAERMTKSDSGEGPASQSFTQAAAMAIPHHTVKPPEWLGWAFISVGSVLMLHSLAMQRPG